MFQTNTIDYGSEDSSGCTHIPKHLIDLFGFGKFAIIGTGADGDGLKNGKNNSDPVENVNLLNSSLIIIMVILIIQLSIAEQ